MVWSVLHVEESPPSGEVDCRAGEEEEAGWTDQQEEGGATAAQSLRGTVAVVLAATPDADALENHLWIVRIYILPQNNMTG